jgi:hypothetical protein
MKRVNALLEKYLTLYDDNVAKLVGVVRQCIVLLQSP